MLQKTPDVSRLSSRCSTSSAGNSGPSSGGDLLKPTTTQHRSVNAVVTVRSKVVPETRRSISTTALWFRERTLAQFNTGILLSGRNTCVEFAPVAMASAKCSAEVTSVRVYARKANLKILFLWGGEINILSKCWKWDGPLHVSKQNPGDKVSVTASLTSLRFISISGT